VKYIDEYRDKESAERFARAIARKTTRSWTIMEVCGGQTHAIVKFGIDELLPKEINLVHGPGCPVCVTPLDAVKIASENQDKEVVFFAVGFETTAPANAMAVFQAHQMRLRNFSLLVSHVLVAPAMEAILSSPINRVQGFLAAGHVCTVMGYTEYTPIVEKYRVPIVVTGFEPLDILQGIYIAFGSWSRGNSRSRINTHDRCAVKVTRLRGD
jgi:hydrogenase expression/formation protein HypD